jgi:hypothetical protein
MVALYKKKNYKIRNVFKTLIRLFGSHKAKGPIYLNLMPVIASQEQLPVTNNSHFVSASIHIYAQY